MADQVPPGGGDLPAALPDPPRRVRLPYVWILPIIVVIVGAFVAVREKLAEGTSIEITFRTADDLEPNKTRISYKAVEIGEVKEIHVSKDRQEVVVEARIHNNVSDYLVEDTRFWVVRPRITGANVTGLGTLVSGAYIGVDVGHSTVPRVHFTGLEVPPIVTSGLPGREYVLHAGNIGSLSIGSTVFYRHIAAGQVVAYSLDPGGASVTIKVFINAPYDQFVTQNTRFWQASGVDMSVDANGVKLHTESLAAILEGGVAFQSPKDSPPAGQMAQDTSFKLYSDEERAMREADTFAETYIMYFNGSLRGLSVGAPVDLRGIDIGEVKGLSVEYDREAGELRFPVEVDIFPQRIRAKVRGGKGLNMPAVGDHTMIDSLVAHGMRAELKDGNLLTGQKYIAVDVVKGAPRESVAWNEHPPIFPTASGGLEEITDSIGSVAKKLDRVPFDQISERLISTMAALDQTLKSTDQLMRNVDASIAPQVAATLKEAQGAMQNAKEALAQGSPLNNNLGDTLLQLSRAAKSLAALADYLERHPEALIRGKPADPK
ncbi:MAG TPA: MlaD family protein [Steroidobacteraceae bacterium]|jgi:paraquat-inducible protein B|nr:MlaD family protein [Steroidobacteraceae bacterium]